MRLQDHTPVIGDCYETLNVGPWGPGIYALVSVDGDFWTVTDSYPVSDRSVLMTVHSSEIWEWHDAPGRDGTDRQTWVVFGAYAEAAR